LATVSTARGAAPDVQLLSVKFVGERLPLLERVFQRCPIVTDYRLVGSLSGHPQETKQPVIRACNLT
jgi:hypothetical protein